MQNVPAGERRPLSAGQRGIWYAQQLNPDNVFVMSEYLVIHGPIDVALFEEALRRTVAEAETVQVRFVEDDDGVWQYPVPEPHLHYFDHGGREDPVGDAEAWMQADLYRPFDLSAAPLSVDALFRIEDDQYLYYQRNHHLIADGVSGRIFTDRLAEIYSGLVEGTCYREKFFASLDEYLADEQSYRASAMFERDREYWSRRLADRPAPVGLSAATAPASARPVRSTAYLSPELLDRLRDVARDNASTWSVGLTAAVAVYLHLVSGARVVPVGFPVMARKGKLLKETPVMASNILALVVDVDPGVTFAEVLRRATREARQTLKHQRYRQEDILRELNLVGGAGQLADVVVNIMPFDYNVTFGGHPVTAHNLSNGVIDDIEITAYDRLDGGPVRIDFDGNEALYAEDEIAGHLDGLLRLLERLVAEPDAPLSRFDLISDEERERVLVEWNDTERPLEFTDVVARVREFARTTPDAIAVVDDSGETTYAELVARASAVSRRLREAGAGPDTLVALPTDPGVGFITAVLGVFGVGAAYVPIDVAAPLARSVSLIEECGARFAVCSPALAEFSARLPGVQVLELDGAQDAELCELAGAPDNLAYALYTSGSTGKPKGALVHRRGMANHLQAKVDDCGLTAADTVVQNAPLTFDISIWQMLSALVVGGRTRVVTRELAADPRELFSRVAAERVTILEVVPSLLRAALDAWQASEQPILPDLRWLLVTGEALPAEVGKRWLAQYPQIPLMNAYGPTECSDDVTHAVLDSADALDVVPIGKALRNTRLYVLDDRLRPVPVGVPGELYVGGMGVGRGYLHDPARTAAVFPADPFTPHAGARMYRTGDYVRALPDGTLVFLERRDHQVKVRGHRIELGEIEAVLAKHPAAGPLAVVVREDRPGDKRLVAYVVPAESEADTETLRAHAAAALPEYMVPVAFVVLPELPLTPNGKLDRHALPEPEYARSGRAPRGYHEELLAGLFADVLGLPSVGVDDGFFDLGGHSLLATRLISRVRTTLDVELSVREVFEAPTVAELAKRLDGAGQGRARITVRERPEVLPPSPAQRRLWFLHQLDEASGVYNIPLPLRLEGKLDEAALRAALGDLVARHETLRTVFPSVGGEPVQQVIPAAIAIARLDGLFTAEAVAEADLADRLTEAAACAFSPAGELPLRIRLFERSETEHVLLIVLHHIAGDGWSLAPLLRDLEASYRARLGGSAPELAALPVQYADYTLWQQEVLGSEEDADSVLAQQVRYWRERLAGLPEALELPTDRPRPAAASYRGGRVPWELDAETYAGLVALSRECRASLFMVLQAAVSVLLSRLGAGTDIPLGTVVAGRTDEALDDLVGFFVNTLVLRTDTAGEPSFRELLDRVRRDDLAAYAHQDVPFERLVEELNPRRSLAQHPLFQVLLVLQNAPEPELELPGLRLGLAELRTTVSKFDLWFDLRETYAEGTGLSGDIEYAADLFDPATVVALGSRLSALLREIVRRPNAPIGSLELLSADERAQLVVEWNDTAREFPDTTLAELLEAVAVPHSGRIAVRCGDESLTYAELHERANRLARVLVDRGVGPENLVAVALPRTVGTVVALLAVLKAGGAYLPVDPGYPAERISFLLSDAAPVCVLTAGGMELPLRAGNTLVLDDAEVQAEIARQSSAALSNADRRAPVSPDNLAYVIYTSGSTGRPKGVAIGQRGVVDLLCWAREYFSAEQLASVLLSTSLNFDVSVFELFAPLAAGGSVEVVENLTALVDRGWSGGLVSGVPSVFAQVLSAGVDLSARSVVLAGEGLSARVFNQVRRTVPGAEIANIYGPTEATVYCLEWRSTGDEELTRAALTGRPLANHQAYVLDAGLRPVPTGVAGELYIAGAGLARGYLGRPGLTGERFVANPFSEDGERMYRTGDLVRWTAGGDLEYLGRADDQVKVRGFRIELGEIESVLIRQPGVEQAAVVVRLDRLGDKQLVAYVVGSSEGLRDQVAARLPGYLVPAVFVELPEFPLNANGKLDRRALPDPEFATAGESREPGTRSEAVLCEVFAEVLELDKVGVDDDFFLLGGHSLLATKLISRVRAALDVELPIRAVFETPTPAGLARSADASGSARIALAARDRPAELPLSFAQRRLWFLNRLDEDGGRYNIPLVLRLSGTLDVEALQEALADVVVRHEALRTVFPEVDGRPRQRILDPERARAALRFRVEQSDEADLTARIRESATAGFDLSVELPITATVFEMDSANRVLSLVLHHIAGDGWSLAPLLRDLATAYRARHDGAVPEFRPLPVQYADYTLWQREVLGSEEDSDSPLAGQVQFWRDQLAGLPDVLDLPTDRPRPAVASHRAGTLGWQLPPELHARLAELAREHRASLFMVLQAAVSALLSRLGAGTDIPLGTAIAGRTDAAVEDLVGFFVNTLVLRTNTAGDPAFGELLDRVCRNDLAGFANQDLPFDRLVELLEPDRSLARHPLFQVMLVLQNTPEPDLDLPGVTPSLLDPGVAPAKFDLSFELTETFAADGSPNGIEGTVDYAADLFDESTVELLLTRCTRLLTQVSADPSLRLSGIELLTAEEREQELTGWNGAQLSEEQPLLPALFEAQAQRTPDRTALVYREAEFSYATLNERANRLAHYLLALGVGPEQPVAVALPRTPETVVAILAVLKAGAVHVPIDPELPAERLAFLLGDVGPVVALTAGAELPGVSTVDLAARSTVDALAACPATDPTDAERGSLTPDHAAYVIYTSGSTGQPKGVVVPHRGLANLAADHRLRWPGSDPMRVALTAVFSFDTAWEGLLLLADGHELHLIDADTRLDPEALTAYLVERRIDFLNVTPSFLHALRAAGLFDGPVPRRIVVGGEAMDEALWRELSELPGVVAENFYGPTESTVDAFTAVVVGDRPAIGRPLPNLSAYVLDSFLRPAPAGAVGELYLAGPQLARGYLGRSALTAERFVANPYGAPGSRLYRTGDLVRRRAGGALEFRGRADDQVKIRGFRIELGEIETALAAVPSVAGAVALARETGNGPRRLVGYVRPEPGAELDPAEVRAALRSRLPDYAVPAAIVVVPEFPLTRNGKLDHRALPEPDFAAGETAPRDRREELLAEVFANVLGLEKVGVEDSFFDLGGDSIVSIQLVSRARSAGLVFTPRDVFEHKTVAGLAEVAVEPDETQLVAADDGVGELPLTPVMRALVESGGPFDGFNQSRLLAVPAGLGEDHLVAAVQALLDQHDALRMRLAEGRLIVPEPGAVQAREVVRTVPASANRQAEADAARGRLSPADGRLFEVVWFDAGPEPGQLLIVAHHLAVDGVSWRIIVPDLAAAWQAAAAGRTPELAPVWTSFRAWSNALAEAARARIDELPFWAATLDGPDPVLGARPLDPVRDTLEHVAVTGLQLPSDLTEALLGAVPAAFHAGVDDVLLTALAMAVGRWRERRGLGRDSSVLIDVESHGRTELRPGMDLSRTVGWFTSISPVRLDPGRATGPAEALKRVKEQLRRVPDKGLGYGLLRHLDPVAGDKLAGLGAPQIAFNYLGRFATGAAGEWTSVSETEEATAAGDPGLPLAHVIEINAVTEDTPDGPRLAASLAWPAELLAETGVRELARDWEKALRELAGLAAAPETGGFTPSDLSLVSLSQADIDLLENDEDE
ncbi:non-ribosomal peptide synthetase [Amycolatopsis benzoatilytica]|uniref:non-ribosomal peptide synthetase n=1 Tax=Amycolatopsis benzoatilytica TaxID=346045 RepID=UPI0003A3E53C|nr:non-ribosomal peptide synthetase [Amycolatopsis benzoatilytica]